MSRVSVIIPNYNCEKWLPLTLDSCLHQKRYLKEIIIIDDYSTDKSWDLLQYYKGKYPDMIKIFKNKVKGGNNARNYGFSLSSGDYIQWLDADDQIQKNKFENQIKLFKSDDTIDIVYSDWILDIYSNDIVIKREFKKQKEVTDFLKEILCDNWSAPHCYLLRRSIAIKLSEIYAWNPETIVQQDREYFTMAAIAGAKFAYTPGYFATYNRWSTQSVSQVFSVKLKNENMEKLLGRFEDSINDQQWFSQERKSAYVRILDTYRILLKVAGYQIQMPKKVKKMRIHWPLVKGIRTTIKVIVEIISG